MSGQRELTGLVNTARVRRTLKQYGLEPTRTLFHMNNTTTVLASSSNDSPHEPGQRRAIMGRRELERLEGRRAVGHHRRRRHYEALSRIRDVLRTTPASTGTRRPFRIHKGKATDMDERLLLAHELASARQTFISCSPSAKTSSTTKTPSSSSIGEHSTADMWRHGMPETLFQSLAQQAKRRPTLQAPPQRYSRKNSSKTLNENWLTETPDRPRSGERNGPYISSYAQNLLERTGEKSGHALETPRPLLTHLHARCPHTHRRLIFGTSEYDITSVPSTGTEQDFRSELGRYFICECKDWSKGQPTLGALAKFAMLLKGTNARLGILFSKGTLRQKQRTVRRPPNDSASTRTTKCSSSSSRTTTFNKSSLARASLNSCAKSTKQCG